MNPTFLAELRRRGGSGSEVRRVRVGGTAEPAAWVEPENAEQVAAVLALCSAEGVPVEPAGAGTWLGAGRPPARAPVVVSIARLNDIVEHEPADLVVGVRAGMPLASLQARLGAHGQMLGLDPPGDPASTTGAVLSLGAAGPLQAAHGTPRDVILGVEVATGDGRLLRFGGRVVKNVAGYDTVRIMTGSRGALGIITSAFLLLRSTPAGDATVLIQAGDAGEAAAMALEAGAAMTVDALEILSPALAAEIGAPAPGWCVAVRLRSGTAALDDAVERLQAAAGAQARRIDGDAGRQVWNRLTAAEADASLAFRIAMGPASLGASLAAAADVVQAASGTRDPLAGWRIAAHGTTGIVRAWRGLAAAGAGPAPGAGAEDEVPAGVLAAALGAARQRAATAGGSLHCPVLPASLHELFDAYQEPPAAALKLMRQIRSVFDPAGIMAPSRYVL